MNTEFMAGPQKQFETNQSSLWPILQLIKQNNQSKNKNKFEIKTKTNKKQTKRVHQKIYNWH